MCVIHVSLHVIDQGAVSHTIDYGLKVIFRPTVKYCTYNNKKA